MRDEMKQSEQNRSPNQTEADDVRPGAAPQIHDEQDRIRMQGPAVCSPAAASDEPQPCIIGHHASPSKTIFVTMRDLRLCDSRFETEMLCIRAHDEKLKPCLSLHFLNR